MTPSWDEEAAAELARQAAYYERKAKGLGDRFIDAVERAIESALTSPEKRRDLGGGIRKERIKNFPHAVVYRPSGPYLRILSVVSLQRGPEFLENRLGPGLDL